MTWLAYSHLGVAKKVTLTTQPSGAIAGEPFTTQPAGKLVDGSGVLSRTSGTTITASKASGTGTLSGTLTQDTVDGLFAFTDLEMDTITAAVTLGFAAPGLTSATSNSFNVTTNNKTIGAAQAIYTLTGTAVTFARTRAVVVSPATFTLTGTAVTLRNNKLAAAAGSYAITGSAVTLTYGSGATLLAAFSATDDGFTTKNGITLSNNFYFDVWSGWSYDGTKAYRAKQGDSSDLTELGFSGLSNLTEVYISWRMYMPDGTEGIGPAVHIPTGGHNDKLLRVWGVDYSNTYCQKMGASTWSGAAGGEYQYSVAAGNRWGMGEGPDANPKTDLISSGNRGRWLLVQFRIKVATSANNDGIIQAWLDGSPLINLTTLATYVFPSDLIPNAHGGRDYFTMGYILGASNTALADGGYPAGQYVYIDDVRFSTGGFA